MREIKEIIVHCSATPEGTAFTVADITRWHKKRGFRTIGYHYVVYLDGKVYAGRSEKETGAHCKGHNMHSIGICYIGGLNKSGKAADTRTLAQRKGMLKLLQELKMRYPHAKIYGHRDFANKSCPCFDATREYSNL